MDGWKAEMGRVREKRRVEERRSEKREDQRRESERVRRKKGQMREKVGKSRNTVFFQWFVAPEGQQVGSLKRRVRSHLARWEMKNCTPLWREAHFEVKMYKAHQGRTTFGSWDVEKVHAIVVRSTFASEKAQNTPGSDHFWKLRCRKSARRCGAKHISKSKVQKTDGYGALLDVQMCFRVAGARDCAPCQKWAKREGFVAFPKTMAGVGHLKRICKDAFSVAGTVQETCSSEMLGGQGVDFLRGVAFWSIRSSGLLRWFCVTGATLPMTWHHFFVAGAILSTGGLEKSENALVRGCQLCTQLSIFEGSLAELLCFWCCQVRKLKMSRRIASFWMLSSSKNEEVSQNCFVFDVVNFEKWGSLAELLRFWCSQLWKWGSHAELLRSWCCQLWKMKKFFAE